MVRTETVIVSVGLTGSCCRVVDLQPNTLGNVNTVLQRGITLGAEEKVKVNRCHFQSFVNKTWTFSFIWKSTRPLWGCSHFQLLKFTAGMKRGAFTKQDNATKCLVYWCMVSYTNTCLRLLSLVLAKNNTVGVEQPSFLVKKQINKK